MAKKKRKFIFVVGGVLSGVGKGVTTASIGAIFRAKGFSVTALKADPYINVDAGTMNPTEHGEVFVTKDGDETDQDMGNYERFLNTDLTSMNYMTTGRVYLSVIEAERSMKYKGKCVQVVPHIPEEISRRIEKAATEHGADVTVIEIGGTVGEYENILFLEAARLMKLKNPDDVAFVLVSYLPVPSHIGEMKTKPTQHAARQLNSVGVYADIIIARSKEPLDKPRREKLALFCNVAPENVISAPDVSSIYEIPLLLEQYHIGTLLMNRLHMRAKKTDLRAWKQLNRRIKDAVHPLRIAVIGKYFGTGSYTLSDSYISVIEAVKHAAWYEKIQPQLEWIDSEQFERDPQSVRTLSQYDAILVPGGFGTRGIEGIIAAIRVAREEGIPYFGLCYGMQLACVEFARHILNKPLANTVEIDPNTTDPIIHVNPFQLKNIKENKYGGTMRLGAYGCALRRGSKTRAAYGKDIISERHRHRFEFNNHYRQELHAAGLEIVGINPETDLVEIVELRDHPFFVGVQFHPEFLSRPMNPHPLFRAFLRSAYEKKQSHDTVRFAETVVSAA